MTRFNTIRGTRVNTFRVSRPSQNVKNGGMDFATRLKRLRKAANLTQEQLAAACGYPSQSRIGNYESTGAARREPPLAELPLIAKALGVTVGTLLGDEPSQSQSALPDLHRLQSSMIAVRKAADRLDIEFEAIDAAPTIIRVYQERVKLPRVLSKDELREFDKFVMGKLEESLGDGRERQQLEGSDSGSGEAAPTKAKARASR